MRLNDKAAQALTIPDGKSELLAFDDDLPNFGLRLRAGGKRTWICQYRLGNKQRRVTLGNLANKGAADARRDAKTLLAKVQLGHDPQTEKFTNRKSAAVTMSAITDIYLATHGERRLKPRTLVEVRRSLKVQWAPLGEAPIDRLTRAAISARLDEIASQSGPFAANRARAYLSGLFSWAIQRGYAEDNPVRFTGKVATETSRDRVLADEELAMIFKHSGEGDYGAIVKLLALTGQRREEVGGMRWSELDLDAALWVIPSARTKNSLAHEVPLSEATMDILRRQIRKSGRDLVFGSGAGAFSGWSNSKAALDLRVNAALKESGLEPSEIRAWRIHDLRRTAATRMADHGTPPHVIEAIINHVSGTRAGVSGIYNRATYKTEKRDALQSWASYVDLLTAGDPNAA